MRLGIAIGIGAQNAGNGVTVPAETITVVDGGVQPGAEQVFDGEDATAGIPVGADELANFETSAPGEQIKSVTVSVSIDGAAPVVISENILAVDPTLNSVTFAAGGSGEPDSITLDVAYTGSDTLEATVETLNGVTTLETVTVALAVPWDNLDLTGLTNASETADSVEVTVSEVNNGGASATVQEAVSGLDLTDPEFASAATNTDGNITTITVTENNYGTTSVSDWVINEDGSPVAVSAASFTEGETTIEIVHDALSVGTTITVDFSGTDITDAKGNPLGSFTGETVQNNTAAASAMEADTDGLYWFNPDSGATDTAGTLTAWADSKNNGFDIAQLGSAPMPDWNGSAAVFDGTQVLGVPITASETPVSDVLRDEAGEITVFIVATLDTSSQAQDTSVSYTILREATSSGSNQSFKVDLIQNNFGIDNTNFDVSTRRFSDGFNFDETLPDGNATGLKVLLELRVDQSTAEIFEGGTSLGSVTVAPSNFAENVSFLEIGAVSGSDGTSLSNGFVGELNEIYATKTTDAQKKLDIRAELDNKHFGGA